MRFREYVEKIKQCYRRFDPSIDLLLLPPVETKRLHNVQSRMLRTFSDELLDILAECNGQLDGFPLFPKLLVGTASHKLSDPHWIVTLEDIEFDTNILNEEFMNASEDPNSKPSFRLQGPVGIHANYLQFTETGGPGFLALDGKPESGGRVNQVVYICTQPLEIAWVSNSLHDLYERIVRGFEAGAMIYLPDEPYPHYRFQEAGLGP